MNKYFIVNKFSQKVYFYFNALKLLSLQCPALNSKFHPSKNIL